MSHLLMAVFNGVSFPTFLNQSISPLSARCGDYEYITLCSVREIISKCVIFEHTMKYLMFSDWLLQVKF